MYSTSPAAIPNPVDDDDRRRRHGSETAVNNAPLPPISTRSPTQYLPYSPTNGTHPPSPYHAYSSRPSTAAVIAPALAALSPRLGLPPSPKGPAVTHGGAAGMLRDPGGSTYYDPILEHREGPASRNSLSYSSNSPVQTRESLTFPAFRAEPKASPKAYQASQVPLLPQASPTFPLPHAHPSTRHNSIPQSPAQSASTSSIYRESTASSTKRLNGSMDRPPLRDSSRGEPPGQIRPRPSEEPRPTRTSDPMAFSSILSSNDPPKPATRAVPSTRQFRKSVNSSNGETAFGGIGPRRSQSKAASAMNDYPNLTRRAPKAEAEVPAPIKSGNSGSRALILTQGRDNLRVKKEMAKIDAMELSDIESPQWAAAKENYASSSRKRYRAIEEEERSKRKRRRTATSNAASQQLEIYAHSGKQRFRKIYEAAALNEVQQKEVQDEKERKKDMQRKRRREKTVQQEMQKQHEAYEKAQLTADRVEREKYMREARKAEKKAKSTKQILERGDLPEEIREVTPMAPNLEGGTMSTFQTGNNPSPEPPKKKIKGPSARPKKTKEKKQAEKDAAEAAYAAMERDELVLIAPKEENRKETQVREAKEVKPVKEIEASPAPASTNFSSKGYVQIYDQIWKDIARKDVSKVYRIKETSLSTKQSNLRKTAQLASKEARRWQLRTNKGMKDVQARAKRSMREMMTFWKRNEREERDLRRVAEKQELENAKKAEADREANRQKRKLNFLISQTELYSHFIGNKIKTNEVERSTDSADVVVSGEEPQPGKDDLPCIELLDSVSKAAPKVTNFEDLDFDAEDETALRQAAMANAQNAVQEAQDRARAFNAGDTAGEDQFDEGEMNFQNPSSLVDGIDVEQPKMLTTQLKEYQLKGLNWLVNLYEQGINGILADEMGLGKTVQSISVMGYLAEKHNIWGPFLVVAPASTLHNWQQEISRFVPDVKCVPYWGNARDRKILRKSWDRKHITYTKDSPFHVVVTSYQFAVQDSQYFQKLKWQYMILDEAQAIKSSQSTRWKSLLGFHCRNRLLLTGTPIQNNMQELWALLHFIMPALFDSHDEFSDWFSKDIESHAQSNTKLNEDQLKRLHMILKPFMLRRIKKHVQKELGDKIEEDVYCDLTYRQRAYYSNLRNRISFMDLVEKATVGDDQDTATLMNLVMQFRKVCNHPDLFERAETTSPLSLVHFAETASFLREGHNVNVRYSTRNMIEYDLPRLLCSPEACLDMAGPGNEKAGFTTKYLSHLMNIWRPENIRTSLEDDQAFAWLRFADLSPQEAFRASHLGVAERAIILRGSLSHLEKLNAMYDDGEGMTFVPAHALFRVVERNDRRLLASTTDERRLFDLFHVAFNTFEELGLPLIEQCARPGASAPPIEIACSNQGVHVDKENTLFNLPLRRALYGLSEKDEQALLEAKIAPSAFPVHNMLPPPLSQKSRFANIQVPSMRRFVTDSGKLAKLDQLLRELKAGSHRVLLYFQMTKMIDLMEEYLTYRNYKYLRLDGSTKLEDRRDTVHDFQTRPDIFIFLLSTRAGGLGINLTAADTVIFYDSDWNPTIDSQAMDRAHRLGQTRQVTVYRMITRGTIEERIRKRALQKEEVQRVVISGGGASGVDFNTRSKENRTKDIAMWLADDEEAEMIERKEKEAAEKGEEMKKSGRKPKVGSKKKDVSLDDMYHEGEGHFDDGSNKPSGAATPIEVGDNSTAGGKRGTASKPKGISKKAKTAKQKLAIADGL